jgi:hypothetical protein
MRAGSPSDAVMMLSTHDRTVSEESRISRPLPTVSHDIDSTQYKLHSESPDNNSQSHSSQSLHLTESQSSASSLAQPPHSTVQPPSTQQPLPPLSPVSPHGPPLPAWTQTKSPLPSNPFYSHAYRSATPPMTSSAEQSPLVSPAKRFSSGEMKPLPFSPTSPRQPLSEEDRQRFTQVPSPPPPPPSYLIKRSLVGGAT